MRTALTLSRVGMNMEEATIVKWHKQPGQAFKAGEPLYEIETEKVNQEITATSDGTMIELSAHEGEIVKVGGQLCVVDLT
jgi:pyruvate/2-oxoglutarate dehydrogenase complex dihydrolipoamide acyltransferase (E2) component